MKISIIYIAGIAITNTICLLSTFILEGNIKFQLVKSILVSESRDVIFPLFKFMDSINELFGECPRLRTLELGSKIKET